ncbi:type II secretion system F family protein [Sandarakinorhabdus sp. DWP1-3-1]|uniref:type II secretion system F family protein n=1 Tax=Sandarakinorhabdus sp. DWP1-3-1 TaxID=2804627 RepID=UPI003CE850C0
MTGDPMTLVIMAMIFVAVVLVVMAAGSMVGRRVDIAERLSTAAPTSNNSSSSGSLRTDQTQSVWAKMVQEVERRGLSLTDTNGDALAERLMLAGFDQIWAARAFVLLRTVLTLILPLLALGVIALLNDWPSPQNLYMILGGSAVVGLYLPNYIVNGRASRRRDEILNGFPDTLDLMLVCVEAGLGIDAAFSRVGTEIVGSHPLLAGLFANVSLELRAGRTREVALRTLARRTAIPEIGAFVTLVVQSDRLGASIGQALKVYAAEMREARRMRAEEKAHRIPVLLSIPLVVFLLPTMLAVLLIPPIINMKNALAADSGQTSVSVPGQK